MLTRYQLFVLLAIATAPAFAQDAGGAADRLRTHQLHSRVFGNTRMLRVLVPKDYDAPANRARRYPVLYLNDGQNLFDSATSTLNPVEWRVDETVDRLIAQGRIPPIIVVGIDNAGRRDRFHEYFPYRDEYLDPPDPDPQGRRYPDFLLREVVPFIEARYRVTRGAENRGLGGSSAGALAAMYAVITRPGNFGRLLIESPSIYVDSARILKEAANVGRWPARVYLGAGTNESNAARCSPAAPPDTSVVHDQRAFRQVLLRAGVRDARIKLLITPCGAHDENAWAARLPEALIFLYGRP